MSDARQTSVFVDFGIAGASTSCATLFTNPLEVVKTRMQLQNEMARDGELVYRNPIQAFRAIFRAESIRGIQAGLFTSIGYQIVIGGTRFSLFEPAKQFFKAEKDKPLYVGKLMLAGISSGCIAAVFGNPFYLMKTRIQAAHSQANIKNRYLYLGGLDGFKQIWKSDGIFGYFRGLGGAMPRVALGSSTQLVSYEYVKGLFLSKDFLDEGVALHFASSVVAGLFCVTAMNPFDVVSVRLYNQPWANGQPLLYTGPVDCIAKTLKQEGLNGFFKGWFAQYFRLAPHTTLTFIFWEQFKHLCNGPSS